MKKNISVSVGICAYNEEKNIKNVIVDVLRQHTDGWKLIEILVYTDGCSDKTLEVVKSISDKRIRIITGKTRLGKTHRLNQMFREFKGEFLIMFDADIKLKNELVIKTMIQEFGKDNSIMLIGGNSMPVRPRTFFQKAVYSTFKVFYASRLYFRDGHNVFGCTGSILGVRKEFARNLHLPQIVNEDAYMYLLCKDKGYSFRYVDEAVVYYKLPENAKDYTRQVLRSEPKAVQHDLEDYFKNVKNELRRPLPFYTRLILKEFFINPVGVSLMIILNSACLPFISMVQNRYSLDWFTASSTKNI